MNCQVALKNLEMGEKCPGMKEIKKQYKTLALLYHPDKNREDGATEKFQIISESYAYLIKNYDEGDALPDDDIYDDYMESEIGAGNMVKGEYIWHLYSFIKSIIANDPINTPGWWGSDTSRLAGYGRIHQIIYKIIRKISTSCEENALEIINRLEKEELIKTYKFIQKYYKVLHISKDFIQKIEKLISEKETAVEYIILKPTLDDLFSNNLYKLTKNDYTYIVPLWHNELVYDNSGCEIYVICEPQLPENAEIDENNNIILNMDIKIPDVWEKDGFSIDLGNKNFKINLNMLTLQPRQTVILYDKGISRINVRDIYNIQSKSDIIVKLCLSI